MTDPVQVCLLVDQMSVNKWQQKALEQMVDEPNVEITTVVNNRADNTKTYFELIKRAIELREWTIVWAIRKIVEPPLKWTNKIPISDLDCSQDAQIIHCYPEKVDGWKNKIPKTISEDIIQNSDVAIRFGFGFLVGDLLTELDYGVLSFHHGDIRKYRGQPAGCWEFIHGQKKIGITLQQITEQLDAGKVVEMKIVSIADSYTYRDIRNVLYKNSIDMLSKAMRQIKNGNTKFQNIKNLGDIYTIPSGTVVYLFIWKQLLGYIQRIYNKQLNTDK